MKLGIIGGSGLYSMQALSAAHWRTTDTPWGRPSDALLEGEIAGHPVVFLPRHGRGHQLAPSQINYRANVAALKTAGCSMLLSVSACGSFVDALPPGHVCLVDQFVDRTHGRAKSFFGDGLVVHASLADPVSDDLLNRLETAAIAASIPHQRGGTYLAMEGPQFSTRAESLLHKAQGMSVIGMTAMPEAALAREAEMAYALAAMVTDFDAWKDEAVSTASVVETMQANTKRAQALVEAVCRQLVNAPLPVPSKQGWERALDNAIVTPRASWPREGAAHLRAIAPRFFV